MKELSIKEKAKAYDEAKARMSRAYNSNRCTIGFMNEIFPELQESEDERVRNKLIEFFKGYSPDEEWWGNITQEDILAWLEKQGEHKPDDKAEPKFHKGDWVVSKLDRKARQISEVHYDEYNEYYIVEGNEYDIEEYDRLHHLWTIQDAKAGDVLVNSSGKPFIFKGFFDNDPMAYGGLVADDSFWPASNSNWTTVYCKPATKEQRDILFQKMKEAGYEWDSEKKELKKIEQNLAWSEEDEKFFDGIIANLEYLMDRANTYTLKQSLQKRIDWLKSLRPQSQWKPSEEQMKALNEVLNYAANHENMHWNDYIFDTLNGLIKQLKNL
jgi:hypothetical protein